MKISELLYLAEVVGVSKRPDPLMGQANSTSGAPSAPTLGNPTAAKDSPEVRREIMKNLANTGMKPNTPQNKSQGGFLAGIAQGFKQGMGMDTDRSIASNLASAGLEKLGLSGAANTVGSTSNPTAPTKISPVPSATVSQLPKPGQMIQDPVTGKGNVKVLPNPGGKGVKLDTTKTLGYPITVDPKDVK